MQQTNDENCMFELNMINLFAALQVYLLVNDDENISHLISFFS